MSSYKHQLRLETLRMLASATAALGTGRVGITVEADMDQVLGALAGRLLARSGERYPRR